MVMLSGVFIGSVLSLSATTNADFTSTIVILKNRDAISRRIMARLSVESGALSVFRPSTPHLLRTIVPFTKKEHGT